MTSVQNRRSVTQIMGRRQEYIYILASHDLIVIINLIILK